MSHPLITHVDHVSAASRTKPKRDYEKATLPL